MYTERLPSFFVDDSDTAEFENEIIESVKTRRQETHKALITEFGNKADAESLDKKSIDVVVFKDSYRKTLFLCIGPLGRYNICSAQEGEENM